MAQLQAIDKISNHNDLLIALESQLARESFNKEILIREIFALWYVLVEGVRCENFTENTMDELLKKKYGLFQQMFRQDPDFNFLMGWMLSIAPWYFNNNLTEDDGYRFLYKAYKINPRNSLYKWALRGQLGLSENEIQQLNDDVKVNFSLYFNYGSMIKEYFLSMLK